MAIVDQPTLVALNVPLETRIRQVALNLQRWRWMPDDLGDRHAAYGEPAGMSGGDADGGVGDQTGEEVGQRLHRQRDDEPAVDGAAHHRERPRPCRIPARHANRSTCAGRPEICNVPSGRRSESSAVMAFIVSGGVSVGQHDHVRTVIERHEVLRTRFTLSEMGPVQEIGGETELDLEVTDLSGLEEAAREPAAAAPPPPPTGATPPPARPCTQLVSTMTNRLRSGSIHIDVPVQRVWDEITKTGKIQRALYNTVLETELRPGARLRSFRARSQKIFCGRTVRWL